MTRLLLCFFVTLIACSGKPGGSRSSTNWSAAEITALFDTLPAPRLEVATEISNNWTVSFPGFPDMRKANVTLPHSVSLPDSEIIYENDLDVPVPGALAVHADDGAQVFIDGVQIRNREGTLFQIDKPGRVRVRIRVLNNAMSGGLKKVTFSSAGQTEKFDADQRRYKRLSILTKQSELSSVGDSARNLIADALLNPDDSMKLHVAEASVVNSPWIVGPVVVFRDSSSARITVIREGPGNTILNWGTDSLRLDNEITCREDVCSFEIPVSGLEEKTIYYQIRAGRTVRNIQAFDVPHAPERFSFSIWADSQSGWTTFETHMRNSLKYNDAFSAGVGDLVGNGASASEWVRLFEILSISAQKRPVFLVPGNHDYDGYYDELVPKNFFRFTQYRQNYFSWQYGNAAFIALDPNERFPIGVPSQSAQYRWLLQELENKSWKDATWRFVLVHQPPYSQGWQGYHGEVVLRGLLEPLIEKHKIDFVVSGHTHDFERLTMQYGKQQVTYLVVGGGGGGLEPHASSDEPKMDKVIKLHHITRIRVGQDTISVHVHDLEDKIIDSLIIMKPRTP